MLKPASGRCRWALSSWQIHRQKCPPRPVPPRVPARGRNRHPDVRLHAGASHATLPAHGGTPVLRTPTPTSLTQCRRARVPRVRGRRTSRRPLEPATRPSPPRSPRPRWLDNVPRGTVGFRTHRSASRFLDLTTGRLPEAAPILPFGSRQPQPCLVDQRSGLQRLSRPFASQQASGQSAQIVVHLVQCLTIVFTK
jgi:hypothetical protein